MKFNKSYNINNNLRNTKRKKKKISKVNNSKSLLKSRIYGGMNLSNNLSKNLIILCAAAGLTGLYFVYNIQSQKVEKLEINSDFPAKFSFLAQNFFKEAGYFGQQQQVSLSTLINKILDFIINKPQQDKSQQGGTSLNDVVSLVMSNEHISQIPLVSHDARFQYYITLTEYEFPNFNINQLPQDWVYTNYYFENIDDVLTIKSQYRDNKNWVIIYFSDLLLKHINVYEADLSKESLDDLNEAESSILISKIFLIK